MISEKSKSTPGTDFSKPLAIRGHEHFAQHWASKRSPTQAAVAAGYSARSAERLARRADVQVRRAHLMGLRAGGLRFDPLTRYGRRMILTQIALDTSNSARDRISAIALYERLYGRDEVEATKTPKAG